MAESSTASTARTPALADLAEDWLAAKRVSARTDDPGNSDRARRDDLCRFGRALCEVLGREVPTGRFELETDLVGIAARDLTSDDLLRSLGLMRTSYSSATAARTLSTMRGFCRWMTRRHYIDDDPCDDDLLKVDRPASGTTNVRAFTSDEVSAMIETARSPTPNLRSAWPERDIAMLEVLAGCGPRASELCSLENRHVDRSLDRPVLRLAAGTKGGKQRDVPLPRRVLVALDNWDASRVARIERGTPLSTTPAAPLFVRADGRTFNRPALYRLVERCATAADVPMPGDAAAHAFRHHFGVQLAIRNVPVPVIQQLMGHSDPRTTSIYMQLAGRELVAALDDAGWL